MSEKLNNLLNKLGAEVLSEDAKAQIIKQFEDLIAEKAQIHVKNAKEKLDAEHSQLLEKLLANIDADHAKKFKIAMEGLDKKYAKKLKVCQSKFNKCINEDAKTFKAKLIAGVSMFLEHTLRDFIPTEMIAESVQAKQNEKMLNELLTLILEHIYEDFEVQAVLMKAQEYATARRSILKQFHFVAAMDECNISFRDYFIRF